jgi:hypothetical protein
MTKIVNTSIAISTIAIITLATTTFAISGNLFPSAYACETNAKGCIEQGGPGSSGLAPAEVSGCHVFPPVAQCAQSSTPAGMGQGSK